MGDTTIAPSTQDLEISTFGMNSCNWKIRLNSRIPRTEPGCVKSCGCRKFSISLNESRNGVKKFFSARQGYFLLH